MHTKGRAQLRVGQMINITHDELRIERRKTTELIVSCFRDLPKVPWSDFFSLRFLEAYISCTALPLFFFMHQLVVYVESKLEDECCPELASGRPALLGAPH